MLAPANPQILFSGLEGRAKLNVVCKAQREGGLAMMLEICHPSVGQGANIFQL